MMPSASAVPMVSTSPSAAPSPSMEPSPTAGVSTLEDAKRVAGELKAELDKMTEVDSSSVVVAGDTALVGLEYATEYQGGMTSRIQTMVESRATSVSNSLMTVLCTDDEEQRKAIEELEKQVDEGTIAFSELQSKVTEMMQTLQAPSASPSTSPSATTGTGTGIGM